MQDDLNNNNIYMKKVEELFRHDFERTRLGKIHRATSNTLLANLWVFIYRLQQSFKSKNTSLPAGIWLRTHMYEFIQQRHIDLNKRKSVEDFVQLMIDAVNSDKVYIIVLHKLYLKVFNFILIGTIVAN